MNEITSPEITDTSMIDGTPPNVPFTPVWKQKKVIFATVLSFIFLFTFLIFVLNRKSGNTQGSVEQIIARAGNAFGKLHYAEALSIAKQGLASNPDNKELLHIAIQSISLQANATGNTQNVLNDEKPYIAEVKSKYSSDSNLLESIGYAFEVAKNYEKALAAYRQALTLDPKNASLYVHLGHIDELLGKQQEAFKEYDTAYALNPTDGQVLVAKGREEVSRNNNDQAAIYFATAADSPTITNNLKAEALTGAAMAKRTNIMNTNVSLALLKDAITADPTYSPATGQYGYYLLFNGKTSDSIASLSKAIALNSSIANNYWMEAIALLDAKRNDEAKQAMQIGLTKIEDDSTLLTRDSKKKMEAQFLYDQADIYAATDSMHADESIKWIKQSIALDPEKLTTFRYDFSSGIFKAYDGSTDFQAFAKQLL